MRELYTVKQLANFAGVSRRTLHYYDEIGLLNPSFFAQNGYRLYSKEDILILQQILFYRELGLKLTEIQDIIHQSDFHVLNALVSHKQVLLDKTKHLQNLVQTIEQTIKHLQGEIDMKTEELFRAFDEKQQAEYETEAMKRWDSDLVKTSIDLWKSYSKEKKAQILKEGETIYLNILNHMEQGESSPVVQKAIADWHQHLRYFYEPTLDVLRGLGETYEQDPSFSSKFFQLHSDFPKFLNKAIQIYCNHKSNHKHTQKQ